MEPSKPRQPAFIPADRISGPYDIELYGTKGIEKVAFTDEPPSIYIHPDWTEKETLEAGAFTTSTIGLGSPRTGNAPPSPQQRAGSGQDPASAPDRPDDTLYRQNSTAFAEAFIHDDQKYMNLAIYDHIVNDWRTVIRTKVDVPAAIFTGEYSRWPPSQKWMASVIPHPTLFSDTKKEEGDHLLMLRNPVKFTQDLQSFLEH